MSLELIGPGNLMTAEQIADNIGISRRAVLKNRNIDNFFAGLFPNPSGTGRPVKMYRPEALSLWNKSDDEIRSAAKKAERKSRGDKGSVRKSKNGDTWATPEQIKTAVELTKQLYINNAQRNLRLACEQAGKMLKSDPAFIEITGARLYRRLQRKDQYFRSEYFTENWEAIRMKKFKVKDHAMNSAGSLRYEYWRIMEGAGIARPQQGACNVIVIDDFKRDAWSQKDGKLEMPVGIAYLDGLTGYPLLILPTPSITTEAVAAGMVMVAYAYGLPEQAIWVMENSRAMKNVNIEMLARSMYTKEELYDFDNGKVDWVKEVFYGQTGPVIRSLSHIPKHAFKAKIERFFKIVKDEFDATRFPLNYQGGSRQEATQLTLAAMPMAVGQETKDLPTSFYTVEYEQYWEELYKWMYSDCIMRSRPVMLSEWAKEKTQETGARVSPTINECFNYYRNNEYKREVDPQKIAYLLYWAQPDRHHPKNLWTVRQTLFIQPTIDNKHLNLFSEAISESVIGRKIATIPIPNAPDRFLLFLADDPERPEFLCIAEDFTARDSKKVPVMRRRVQVAREAINERLDEGAKTLAVWENQHEPGTQPQEPPKWSKALMPGYVPELEADDESFRRDQRNDQNEPYRSPGRNGHKESESVNGSRSTVNEINQTAEIADDMADLLGEIESLIQE